MTTHNPLAEENTVVPSRKTERLQFFLTRTLESEEIWALTNENGWILEFQSGHSFLRVWCERALADEYAKSHDPSLWAKATSLDHFVENMLNYMAVHEIKIELMPSASKTGLRLKASELLQIYTSLIDSGTYFLEG